MEAKESLTALKKAYADVIMGITEEAATRVMVSQKKSKSYQHELKAVKENGVRMLLQLKQMVDAQTMKTQAASLRQLAKIEELEAQLDEAEEIVRDLRQELEEVQAELETERAVKENSPRSNDPESRQFPRENDSYSYQTGEYSGPFRNECSLPSIISKNKDHVLYRYGCTQRIHACEWNLSKRDSSLSGEADVAKDKDNTGDETSIIPDSVAKTINLLADPCSGSPSSFLTKRKRSTRQKNTAIGSDGSAPQLVPVNDISDPVPPEADDQVFPRQVLNPKEVKFTYQRRSARKNCREELKRIALL